MNIAGFGAASWTPQIQDKKKESGGQDFMQALLNATSGDSVVKPSGAASSSQASLTEAPKKVNTAADKFLDYMKMTPGQKMQYAWLAQHGVTKEQFDALSPEEQQKLLAKMREEIQEKIKQNAHDATSSAEEILS